MCGVGLEMHAGRDKSCDHPLLVIQKLSLEKVTCHLNLISGCGLILWVWSNVEVTLFGYVAVISIYAYNNIAYRLGKRRARALTQCPKN